MGNLQDQETPVFSGMILDWMSGMKVGDQIDFLRRMRVPHNGREAYLQALEGHEVALPAGMVETIDITPTMAIAGLPTNKNRPKPSAGQDLLARPTIDLRAREI